MDHPYEKLSRFLIFDHKTGESFKGLSFFRGELPGQFKEFPLIIIAQKPPPRRRQWPQSRRNRILQVSVNEFTTLRWRENGADPLKRLPIRCSFIAL